MCMLHGCRKCLNTPQARDLCAGGGTMRVAWAADMKSSYRRFSAIVISRVYWSGNEHDGLPNATKLITRRHQMAAPNLHTLASRMAAICKTPACACGSVHKQTASGTRSRNWGKCWSNGFNGIEFNNKYWMSVQVVVTMAGIYAHTASPFWSKRRGDNMSLRTARQVDTCVA